MKIQDVKVGDKLRILNNNHSGHNYPVGSVVEVVREVDAYNTVECLGDTKYSKGQIQWLCIEEFEVLPKVEEFEVLPKVKPFKVLSPKTSTRRALQAVRRSMEARGWTHGQLGDKEGPCCLLGHVALVTTGDPQFGYDRVNSIQGRLKKVMAAELGCTDMDRDWAFIYDFNDHGTNWPAPKDRETGKHVYDFLDTLIAKY